MYQFLQHLIVDCEDKFTDLNCGGCGLVAMFISEQLEKRNINHSFRFRNISFYNEYDSVDKTLQPTIQNLNKYCISAGHIFLIVNRKPINSVSGNYTHKAPSYRNSYIRNSIWKTVLKDIDLYNNCNDLYSEKYHWNTSFNVMLNHNYLNQFITEEFEKYDKRE